MGFSSAVRSSFRFIGEWKINNKVQPRLSQTYPVNLDIKHSDMIAFYKYKMFDLYWQSAGDWKVQKRQKCHKDGEPNEGPLAMGGSEIKKSLPGNIFISPKRPKKQIG